MRKHLHILVLMAALSLILTLSCARDYVTGKRTFSMVSESQEIAMGAAADPQIVAEYGIYDDPRLLAFVDSIGQSIARVSHRPTLQYTFRVVDSPVVNAFALPGGWVYFTRGILAHFNSEDELAGVMGHEVGHVVARHGAEQQSKATLAQLGMGVGSILSPEFYALSGLVESGVGLLFLSFGRGQESESDRLGVEYSTKLGYNAHRMAEFFRTIGAMSQQSGQSIPTFLSTHPNPENREITVNQLADEWQSKIAYQPRNTDRRSYLRRIDGIVFGDDPRQGFVENNTFYHPQLRFQFPVPPDWNFVNTPSQVVMVTPNKDAIIQFTLAQAGSPAEAATAFINNTKASVEDSRAATIHGFKAHEVLSRVSSGNDVLGVRSTFIQKESSIFVFHGYTAVANFSKYNSNFSTTARGFETLRDQAALNKQPARVRIVKTEQSGTLAEQLARFKMDGKRHEELAILNGMKLDDQVQRGDYLKIVRAD